LQRQKSKARGQPETGSFWEGKGGKEFGWSGRLGSRKKFGGGGVNSG